MTLGERILKYRKKAGISQEELADKLNVTRQSISLWETDQTLPSLDNLIALAEIFDVSMDELCGRKIYEPSREKVVVENGTVVVEIPATPQSDSTQIKTTFINKNIRDLLTALFILTLFTVLLGFITTMIAFDSSPLPEFSDALSEYMWIFFLFLPIPIASIVLGIIFLTKKYKCKKNIVAGAIMCAVLCLFGQFSFSLKGLVQHDDNYIKYIDNTLPIDLADKSAYVSYMPGISDDGLLHKAAFKCKNRNEIIELVTTHSDFHNDFGSATHMLPKSNYPDCNYYYLYNATSNEVGLVKNGRNRYIMLGYNVKTNVMYVWEFMYEPPQTFEPHLTNSQPTIGFNKSI